MAWHRHASWVRGLFVVLLVFACLAAIGCDAGAGAASTTVIPPPPLGEPPTGSAPAESEPAEVGRTEPLPGLVVDILALDGGTGPGGSFAVGDTIRVKYAIRTASGKAIPLGDVDYGGIMVSGPTSGYQRVLPLQTDLIEASQVDAQGNYVYTFSRPIPAAYLPPLNDSPAFGTESGERTGQPLDAGTYTVGIEAYRAYAVEGCGMMGGGGMGGMGGGMQCCSGMGGGGMGGMGGGMQCCGGMSGMGGGGMGGMSCCCEMQNGQMVCKCCSAMMRWKNTTLLDAGNATRDFALGAAVSLEPREVVTAANCNACHAELRAHGGMRRDVKLCSLCHTAGAEDAPRTILPVAAALASHTVQPFRPASIELEVMVHKIHSGAHLPSVLGVGTNKDGSRNYARTPQPYQIVGSGGVVHDYSRVDFPVWPNRAHPLPRDAGYASLTAAEQALEDAMRSGAASCEKCHGDPDAGGPLPPPAQGHHAFTKPNRDACGSCHDDVDWTRRYASNQMIQPVLKSGADCTGCHPASGAMLAVEDGHRHPLEDPEVDPGLVIALTAVRESGNHNGNGKLDPGEKIQVSFDLRNDRGQPVSPAALDRLEVALSGPATNRNILVDRRWPIAALSSSSVVQHVPEDVHLELVGCSTAATGEVFATRRTPHWNIATAGTTVFAGGSTGGAASALAAGAHTYQNFVDVVDATGFARGDYVVVDAGQPGEEYLRVQLVDGDRLWFSSIHGPYDQPWLRGPHASGAAIAEAVLTRKVESVDYALDPTTGRVTELIEFGAGVPVIVSYTTDFIVPVEYGAPMNDSPDVGESYGEWAGKSLVSGTYTLGIWGERTVRVTAFGETTTYPSPCDSATRDFLVGTATALEPSRTISSAENCNACHNRVMFHGGHRQGLDTCLLCHGAAGSEDRPRYVSANAPATTAVSSEFRRMLHKIHMGEDLTNASTYMVVGFGAGYYPENYSVHTYESVVFPGASRTKRCTACHGDGSDAWKAPVPRTHPAGQEELTRVWNAVCSSCHDGATTQSHIESKTDEYGAESCGMCHAPGKKWSVDGAHLVR